jgi:hypothetical protein
VNKSLPTTTAMEKGEVGARELGMYLTLGDEAFEAHPVNARLSP